MSRAALRSTLVLTAVTGLFGAGLLQAAVAGAAESWQLSADGTTATYSSLDTGSELPFLVPAGVTSLDVTVLGDEDAAPATQQIAVPPGSTLVFDLGLDDELIPTVAPAPGDALQTAPSELEAPQETAPASWYIAPGNGAAASIRVADPAELAVAEQDTPAAEGRAPDAGTATLSEDVPAGTSSESPVPTDGVPPEVPIDVPGRDGEVVAQDPAGDDAPVSVAVSFRVPTPGELPAELQAPEWLAPVDAATADERAVRAEETGTAEDSLPVEPSAPSGSPAPADVLTPAEVPAPVETPPDSEAASEVPDPIEVPAPVEPAAATVIAAEPTAPVAVETSAEVIPPPPTAPTASSPEPTTGPRRAASPASSSVVPAEPSAAARRADERPTVDLQTAASMVPADLFDADGVGVLTASLVGVVVLGVSVTVAVGVRRRD